jgi:hypothetical protein
MCCELLHMAALLLAFPSTSDLLSTLLSFACCPHGEPGLLLLLLLSPLSLLMLLAGMPLIMLPS